MKKLALIICICISSLSLLAQQPDYRVVFDMSSKDSVNQQTVIRELQLIREANPDASLQVVVYGQGMELVVKNMTQYEPIIQDLISNKGIMFRVCGYTMKRHGIKKEQLIPGVVMVNDGIYEIISKQRDGWGYIKVGH